MAPRIITTMYITLNDGVNAIEGIISYFLD